MSGETGQASPNTPSISRCPGVDQPSPMRRRDAAERNGSWCRAATDSDAQTFETGRFRNASPRASRTRPGCPRRVKDHRDQGLGRFPTETNVGQTTYIASRPRALASAASMSVVLISSAARSSVSFIPCGQSPRAAHQASKPARQSLKVPANVINEIRPHWALAPPQGGDLSILADIYVHGLAVGLLKWQGWAKEARAKLEQMTEDMHFPFPAGLAPQSAA